MSQIKLYTTLSIEGYASIICTYVEPDGSCGLIIIAKLFYEINQWRSYAPKYRIYSSCLPHTGKEVIIGNLHQSPQLFKELNN